MPGPVKLYLTVWESPFHSGVENPAGCIFTFQYAGLHCMRMYVCILVSYNTVIQFIAMPLSCRYQGKTDMVLTSERSRMSDKSKNMFISSC